MMSMSLSNIAISDIKFSDYCCISILISKAEAINLMQNADLTEKKQKFIKSKTKSDFEALNLNGKSKKLSIKKM